MVTPPRYKLILNYLIYKLAVFRIRPFNAGETHQECISSVRMDAMNVVYNENIIHAMNIVHNPPCPAPPWIAL
jgi:hypothetical protein